MSYQTGDKVKLLKNYPYAPKDSIIEIVNWQYANIWLVTVGSGLSKFNFHIAECDFELVKSANTPLTSNGVGAFSMGPGIVSIPPGYSGFASGGGSWGSGITASDTYQVGDIVKFIGNDEPVLKTGMTLQIEEIRPDSHFNCSIYGQNREDFFMVLKDEISKFSHSNSLNNNHHCTWKNYKGLSYQEEYCDGCGKSKNRRGLYA